MRISLARFFSIIKTAATVSDFAVRQSLVRNSEIIRKVKKVVDLIDAGYTLSEAKGDLIKITGDTASINPTPATDEIVKAAHAINDDDKPAVATAIVNTVDAADVTPPEALDEALLMLMGDGAASELYDGESSEEN